MGSLFTYYQDMISILEPKIQQFIHENLKTDFLQLSLKKNPFPEIDYKLILQQIESKNKAKHKIPSWFNTQNLIYPNKISLEQCSSEATALYKTTFLKGKNLIDITGGMGVDTYFLSKNFDTVVHCEINENLSKISSLNFKTLGAENIQCFAKDGIEVLKESDVFFDWIYVDPSRRNDVKGKVFLLEDCLPNMVQELDLLFHYTNKILIKVSPMYDIFTGIKELKHIKNIHIVAVQNEVKEVLFELDKSLINNSIVIKTINIENNHSDYFECSITENQNISTDYSLPLQYLYEPNAAIMKSQCFNCLGRYFQLKKLHLHSHLYTSDSLINFTGKSYQITKYIPYNKQNMKDLTGTNAVVKTRNFSESAEQLRKKWKLKESSSVYYFFTTDMTEEKIVLICQKN